MKTRFTRRSALALGSAWAAGTYALVRGATGAPASELTTLDVAYAGSMGSLMEGPIKEAAAHRLGLALRGRAQGASALARLITGGSIRPDVFISVTPGPMEVVLAARKARRAQPIARTEMVIAYSPKSRFAEQFAASTDGGGEPWWKILEQPGIRFGRTDPNGDPQGRNIIFTMQLAARFYHQPDLVARILGPAINPAQIFPEPTVVERLQAGSLDASSAYKIQPVPFKLPYLRLPEAINLGDASLRTTYAQASLTLAGKTYHPAPLVYYAAALEESAHAQAAGSFVEWLRGDEAQAIFRRYAYDAPGDAAALTA